MLNVVGSRNLVQRICKEGLLRRMVQHARLSAPYEACGALFQLSDGGLRLAPVDGSLQMGEQGGGASSATSYTIPAELLLQGLARDERLMLVYHSHPAAAAILSQADISWALVGGQGSSGREWYPGLIQLVLGCSKYCSSSWEAVFYRYLPYPDGRGGFKVLHRLEVESDSPL